MLSTYHCHTSFCDGKSTAEEMVLAAIEAGCAEIGFTGHSHIRGFEWTMSEAGEREYRKALLSLREKYCDRIRIFLGIELDTRSSISTAEREEYDFILGSAHAVFKDGVYMEVDASAQTARSAALELFDGDPYAYCEEYYKNVSRVYEVTGCDIIGHFDLVTKFIEIDPMFSQTHPRYIAARDKALEQLLKTPALFEVNTGAISRGYRTAPYPTPDVILRIAEAGKPLVINSDSHKAETVVSGIPEAEALLKSLRAPYVTSLSEVLRCTRG